ncbi:MAG: M28 family peptidase [Bacteroidales bacterium]
MKKSLIRNILFPAYLILVFQAGLLAQTKTQPVYPPKVNDFAPILNFLASPALEGRETGQQGGIVAAEYIASMMHYLGLKPYKTNAELTYRPTDYFQEFKLLRQTAGNASVDVIISKEQKPKLQLRAASDFRVFNLTQPLAVESVPVFAGYGIADPALGYNDYAGLNVKGKIVLIMPGYPGQHDTASVAWKKFRATAENDDFDLDKKCAVAAKQGAAAVIIVNKAVLYPKQTGTKPENNPVNTEPEYISAGYSLPKVESEPLSVCFRLNKKSSEKLALALGIDFIKAEKQVAEKLKFTPVDLKSKISLKAKPIVDTLLVNNVIGKIQGRDSTQTIILGAHYDHLGKRGNIIYYGSDDNASGVAGLLALAKSWTQTIPPCNIIFASWTAEEKGLIGSEYFASTLSSPDKVKLYINMDMISRSVAEDTARRQLSIGTRTTDNYLRELASQINNTLSHPFILDLWDVTGHSGSDYASFIAKNIPVMTYNTGLHNDYHTPRDIPAAADLTKMGDVLRLVNESMQVLLSKTQEK